MKKKPQKRTSVQKQTQTVQGASSKRQLTPPLAAAKKPYTYQVEAKTPVVIGIIKHLKKKGQAHPMDEKALDRHRQKVKAAKKSPPNLSKVLKEKVNGKQRDLLFINEAGEGKKINYSEHWKNMPEFIQPSAAPIKALIVNFASKEDMHRFSKLVGQAITAKTRSIWFPEVEEQGALNQRYSDSK